MQLSISVKITGDERIRRKLKVLGDSIHDHRSAMKEIGKQASEYYRTIGFTDRGQAWGNPWPDYSPAYKKYKEKHGFASGGGFGSAGAMLVLTGNMRDSFTAKETRDTVKIGNSATTKNGQSLYRIHQSSEPRSKIPRRQMAGINGNIKDIVKTVIRNDIKDKLARV